MGREVKHYIGYDITNDVIDKINLMAMSRYEEGFFSALYDGVDTLEQLCAWHGSLPEEENVLLGEDWTIVYVKRKNEIELVEWLDVEVVPDKIQQTMEMVKAMRKVLLEGKEKKLVADMRQDTSYKFYQMMLKHGYLESFNDYVGMVESAPSDVITFGRRIVDEYGSLDNYFSSDNREVIEDYEKYFYHSVSFGITDKFVKRYKK